MLGQSLEAILFIKFDRHFFVFSGMISGNYVLNMFVIMLPSNLETEINHKTVPKIKKGTQQSKYAI